MANQNKFQIILKTSLWNKKYSETSWINHRESWGGKKKRAEQRGGAGQEKANNREKEKGRERGITENNNKSRREK